MREEWETRHCACRVPLGPARQAQGRRLCLCGQECIVTEGLRVMSTGPGGNRAPASTSASPRCPDT